MTHFVIFFLALVLGADSAFSRNDSEAPAACDLAFRQILNNMKLSVRPPEERIRRGAFVLDTNVFSALERMQNQQALSPNHRILVKRLVGQIHVDEKDLMRPERREARFYYSRTVIDELSPDREWRGANTYLRGSSVIRSGAKNKIAADRARGPIMETLKKLNVGGSAGQKDREIIAEILLAETEPGVVPSFVTADRGIFERLCAHAARCQIEKSLNGRSVVRGDFEVEIEGRRLRVIPISLDP